MAGLIFKKCSTFKNILHPHQLQKHVRIKVFDLDLAKNLEFPEAGAALQDLRMRECLTQNELARNWHYTG